MDKSDVGSMAHIKRQVGFPLLSSGMTQPTHGMALHVFPENLPMVKVERNMNQNNWVLENSSKRDK